MKVAVFSTKPYDRRFLDAANAEYGHELRYFEPRLNAETASLAAGFEAVCVFVNDVLDAQALETLVGGGTRLIALRCAGFNNVDLQAAEQLGVSVVHVPAYSPHAVAEHTVGLMLTLNRQFHRAYNRVREGNFALDGLLGFDLHTKSAGIIGTGQIGSVVARILRGMGCELLGYDVQESEHCREMGLRYTSLDELYATCDIITLHCPLVPETHHLIDAASISQMRQGVMLINTGRGALIDTNAVIAALKTGRIGYLGLDVYEEEANLFFEDLSGQVIQDDVFARLLTFPNVLITGHQAFFTAQALQNIASTTLCNVTCEERGDGLAHRVTLSQVQD